MPKITAIIHTQNDARRIGRAVESLRPCDEILVIDNNSQDGTARFAREHGAHVKPAVPGVTPGAYLADASNDWILSLLPNEALAEALEAALFEWKHSEHKPQHGYSVAVREETEQGWKTLPPETRLVNRTRINWTGTLPPNDPQAEVLSGDLLRFSNP